MSPVSSPLKRMHVFPAMFHAIFHEQDRAQVIERLRDFIEERFAHPPLATSLRNADHYGYLGGIRKTEVAWRAAVCRREGGGENRGPFEPGNRSGMAKRLRFRKIA